MYGEAVLLCFILLFSPVTNRKISVGGSNRGSSSSRQGSQAGSQSSGFRPNQGGGFQTNQGGFYQPNRGSNFNVNQQSGYRPGGVLPNQRTFPQPGFKTGTGPGSASRGSQFKTALAAGAIGAVGGIVTYELGKAIINSATSPFRMNNNNYYFGEQNYKNQAGMFMCSMPLEELIKQTQGSTPSTTTEAPVSNETNSSSTPSSVSSTPSPDQLLASLQFKDGTRPRTVTWGCKVGSEVCCGTECCPAPPQTSSGMGGGNSVTGIIFGVLVALLLLTCCACCIIYTCFRSLFNSCLPSNNSPNDPNVVYTDGSKYDEAPPANYGGYPNQQQQGYPMQPYPSAQPGGGYPVSQGQYPMSQGGYPPTQGYSYPSQPPAFQYPDQSYAPRNY